MLEAADPADEALDAHAEAAVGDAAVAAQVEIPLEGFLREVVLLDPRDEQIEIGEALAAADDFTVALWRQDVDAQRDLRTIRIRLHIERLHLRRIPVHADRAI